MSFNNFRAEFYNFKKAAFEYHRPWPYFYLRYFVARKIFNLKKEFKNNLESNNLSIHLLTCHRDLNLLVWSLASFFINAKISGELFIHNDGTLSQKDCQIIKKFFPQIIIVTSKECEKKIEEKASDFSESKNLRKNFLLLKKLVDPYFFSSKDKILIIDSDLIWFQRPEDLISQIKQDNPDSLMMHSVQGGGCPVYFSNGEKLAKDLSFYNSGIVFYQKENFDLARLKNYLSKIDQKVHANKHFIEQAGYAYCLNKLKPLPEDFYQIKGSLNNQTKVKHYTSPRRFLFYLEGINYLKDKILKS
ncbi:MAG TPA: hypothetical protein VJG65_02005 [Patescibacteria group bacterium]|nr:hypothetical protein [Patescibacteria group bacterium]